MSCILKRYTVGVVGYGDALFYAKDKNQARMRAFNAIQSANDAINFKKFLTMVAFINEAPLPEGFGRPILVSGKPAFWVEHAGGNSVRFAWPDDATVLISHELDVEMVA